MNILSSRSLGSVLAILLAATSAQPLANAAEEITYSQIPAVDCVINPYRVVDISSPVAGVIEELFVDRSQQVRAGQVIARLEASVERANVDLARYRASVESDIELGRVNINFDRMRKQRIDQLLEESNISRENADQVEREVQLSEWKLKQARELAEIRKLELRRAQAQLRQKSISSPFDGFVLDIFKFRGEYVEDQAIARLAQLDPLVIETIVPMENFGQIQPGMQAEVVPEILHKDKLRGQVIAVDRIGDTASNTFGVKLSLPNPENRIPAGLKCVAKFIEMTPEQIAAQASAPAAEQIAALASEPAHEAVPDPSAAETGSPGLPEPESTGLMSVIGTANAATNSSAIPDKPENPISEESLQPINGKHVEAKGEASQPLQLDPVRYMVLIDLPENEAATNAIVERLRNAGENDFFVYNKSGRISLGFYRNRALAERRLREMQDLGFSTRMEPYQ